MNTYPDVWKLPKTFPHYIIFMFDLDINTGTLHVLLRLFRTYPFK
jgi:hypothetical protein